MSLRLYNSLSREKEIFEPLVPGRVRMYVCGPTVYDYPHIGHAKSYVSFDVIVRYLRYSGYNVRYVQNITDVGHLLDSGEDRILKGAEREKVEPMELVERYTRAYFEAMDALNVQRPDISPHAAAHIPEQIKLVQDLLQKGCAYEANGSVYFDITNWQEYGKLSGRKFDEQQAGARIDVNPEKRHPADFALWKKAEPEHVMQWDSPWGPGYPGWHIECSAMSMKYLGETLDIHGGGMENQFPHHECEIAQSEAATGKRFVRYWLHNNMVLVDGVKMSKSLGNFTTVSDALKRFSGEELRFFILQTHYRSPVDFSDEAIKASAQGLERLHKTYKSLVRQSQGHESDFATQADSTLKVTIDRVKADFEKAMDDDFNTPLAIAALFDFSREINKALDGQVSVTTEGLAAYRDLFVSLAGDVLGLLPKEEKSVSAEPFVELLLELRSHFRADKNWQMADYIRDELQKRGVEIEDSKEGSRFYL
jgi:cysteinyl-tRNA synthetase